MSRRIDYLVQDLTDGTQKICYGRDSLCATLWGFGCKVDKNKLSKIRQKNAGVYSFSLLSKNNHDISIEELFE
jgi:hypothetical protein